MNPDSIYKDIGMIIRARRKALKMTQDELSRKLGISRGALANVETGRQNILVHQLYNYASKLELNVGDLVPVMRQEVNATDVDTIPVPSNVNRNQAEQISRLIQGASTNSTQSGEVSRGKSARR